MVTREYAQENSTSHFQTQALPVCPLEHREREKNHQNFDLRNVDFFGLLWHNVCGSQRAVINWVSGKSISCALHSCHMQTTSKLRLHRSNNGRFLSYLNMQENFKLIILASQAIWVGDLFAENCGRYT